MSYAQNFLEKQYNKNGISKKNVEKKLCLR